MAAVTNSKVKFHNKPFDRFIPYRPLLDVDAAYAQIRSTWDDSGKYEPKQYISSSTKQYLKLLADATGHQQDGKILPIGSKTSDNNGATCRLKTEYSTYSIPKTYWSPGAQRRRARVPTSPEMIMDVPGLQDDYYTNVLDWSASNMLAVALYQTAYVLYVDTMDYKKMHVDAGEQPGVYISALCWAPADPLLAIADNSGHITVFNIEQKKAIHEPPSPTKLNSAIGVVQWTEYGITSGNAKGVITVHDQRTKPGSSSIKLKAGKICEIIGLRQAPGLPYLASGGEAGVVDIWDLRMHSVYTSISAHSACAKALSWCPFRPGVLATGGGSADGYIRLWQVHTGEKLGEAFTQSQICGLLWSKDYSELVSAHGSATRDKNDLVLWSMANLEFEPVSVLRHHLARPLHIALSPSQTTVASVGADEALCLWNAFPKRCRRPVWNNSALNLFKQIR